MGRLDRHPTACAESASCSSTRRQRRGMRSNRHRLLLQSRARGRARDRRCRARREGEAEEAPDLICLSHPGPARASSRGTSTSSTSSSRSAARSRTGSRNTGAGPWALRPEHAVGREPTTTAIAGDPQRRTTYKCGEEPKQITACYDGARPEIPMTIFQYHPTHNHWHTADVALFEVRGAAHGPIVNQNSRKTRLPPDRPLTSWTATRPTSEKVVLGLLHELPGRSRQAGSTSTTRPPMASRST